MFLDPLSQLRDVILPPDPVFWPPALGWWLLLIGSIAALVGAVYLVRLVYWRLHRKSLVKEVDALACLQPQQAVVELSVLMRRIAITKYSRNAVAGLSGDAWLEFLDESGETDQFTRGPGQLLASAPYSDKAPGQLTPLFEVCRNWVKIVS